MTKPSSMMNLLTTNTSTTTSQRDIWLFINTLINSPSIVNNYDFSFWHTGPTKATDKLRNYILKLILREPIGC